MCGIHTKHTQRQVPGWGPACPGPPSRPFWRGVSRSGTGGPSRRGEGSEAGRQRRRVAARCTGTACGAGRCLPLRGWEGGARRAGRAWSAAPGASPRRALCPLDGGVQSRSTCLCRVERGPRGLGGCSSDRWGCRSVPPLGGAGGGRGTAVLLRHGPLLCACVQPSRVSRWARGCVFGALTGGAERRGVSEGWRCPRHLSVGSAGARCGVSVLGSSRPWQAVRAVAEVRAARSGRGWSSPSVAAPSLRWGVPCPSAASRVRRVHRPYSRRVAPVPGSPWQDARAPGGHRSGRSDCTAKPGVYGGHRGGSLSGRPGWPGCVGDPCSGPPPVPGAVRSLRAGRQVVPASEVAHQRGWACRLCAGRGAVALGQVTCRAGLVIVCSALPSPQAQHMGRPCRARVRVATGSFGWQGGCTAAPGCALGGQGRGVPLLPAPRASGCGAPA